VPDPLDQPVAPRTPVADDADDRAELHGPPADNGDGDHAADDHDGPGRSYRAAAARASTVTSTSVGDDVQHEASESDGATGDGGVGDETDVESEDEPRKPRSRTRTIVEWALVIGGALLVALVVRSTLAQAFWIPSPSMEPTLHEGDRVLVNKLSYDLHDVNRGDIIVFERPETAAVGPDDDISDLIKRVIGLPGDVIESRPDGNVYVNGRRLDEPYLPEGTRTTGLERQEVPEDHVFVMGDNRSNSTDSRVFGAVDEDLIIGRAFIRIWPLGDIGGL
jgi:signal peptidase I